jgi:flagellar biosynthesis GTPase FlhF
MEYIRKHKKGIFGTFIFHIIVLILLIFLGFFTPLPLPGEEGILVNFGTSDNGLGDFEPSPARNNPVPAKPVIKKEEKKEVPPPTAPPVSSPPKVEKQTPAKEVAMTQDYEKTAALEAAEKKKKEEDIKRQQQLEEQRRQQQIREEQQRREEAERLRKEQEEAERIRKAEAERKAKEEEQRKINEINSRVQGAFADNGNGTGGQGTGTGKSQGATFPGGNQGVPTGSSGSGNYGDGGSGNGSKGSGVSYNLSGRSANSLPKPKYPGDDEGLVVVKVTVDKFGNVTAAEPGTRGTTIMNQKFWDEAKQAALKAKFNTDENAPAFQQGTISYRFVLD